MNIEEKEGFGAESIEVQERVARLLEQFGVLSADFGIETVRKMLAVMQESVGAGRQVDVRSVQEVFEGKVEREVFQKEALDYLEKQGFIEYDQNGNIVVDHEKLFNDFSYRDLRVDNKDRKAKVAGCEVFGLKRLEFFGNAFLGHEVKLKSDVLAGVEELKPLFYLPQTQEEMLDAENIRNSDFHFGLWEVPYTAREGKESIFDISQPGAKEDFSLFEASVAAMVLHPNYGDGRRNSRGLLEVKDEEGNYKRISGRWFVAQGISQTYEGKTKAIHQNPRGMLQKLAPNILESGIIELSDFQRKSNKAEMYESVYVNSKGLIRFNNVRYYLGPEFTKFPIQLSQISKDKIAIIKINEESENEVVAVFDYFEHGDSRLKERSYKRARGGSAYTWDAPKKLTNVQFYESDSENSDLDTETLKQIKFLEQRIEFDEAIFEKSGELVRNLPKDLFDYFSKNSYLAGEELLKSVKVVEKAGKSGLETVVLLCAEPEALESINRLANKMNSIDFELFAESIKEAAQEKFEINSFNDFLLERGASQNFDLLKKRFEKEILDLLRVCEDLVDRKINNYESLVEQMRIETGSSFEELSLKYRIDYVSHFCDVFDASGLRDIFNEIAQQNDSSGEYAVKLLRILNPEAPDEAHKDLRDLYANIKFEEYKVNEEMQKTDESVLSGIIDNKDKVLDLGAGTGRLAIPLFRKGVDITALDYVKRHVKLIKKQAPDLNAVNTDWTNTGLESESFNVLYSLGRSISHEFNPDRQKKLFAEANRLLKFGGRFCFDVPNREKGQYKELVKKYAEIMGRRNLAYREGTIYDSPDGENYFTRYIYSISDIRSLATDNGFEVEEIRNENLENGYGDENIYFVLKKVRNIENSESLAA